MAQILLIEPDSVLADIYRRALQQAGHRVVVAAGAQTAISLADQHQPQLVIVELQLAGHNGLEFLYEFRSYRDWQGVPVLIHTLIPPSEFNDNSPLARELIAAYLYKPRTSLEELLRAVDNCLTAASRQPA